MPRIKKFNISEEEKARLEAAGFVLCSPVKGRLSTDRSGVSEGYLIAKHKYYDYVIFKRNDCKTGAYGNGLWELPNNYEGLKLSTENY